jgi:hypothetical protein
MKSDKRVIHESYRWHLNRNQVSKAERIVRYIFKDEDILFRLLNITHNADSCNKKQTDSVTNSRNPNQTENGNSYGSLSYAMFMWRITFKKIVLFLILIWSLVSFVSFFVYEDDSYRFLPRKIDSYVAENLIVGLLNILMSLAFLR